MIEFFKTLFLQVP